MDYALGLGLAAAGVAIMVFVKPLRPVSLLAFALAGYVLRDGKIGELIRQGLSISGKWLGDHELGLVVPYLTVVVAVAVAVALASSIVEWNAGFGTAVLALAFPTLLVMSGDSPPATAILHFFEWATSQIATATTTKGTR